MDLRTVGDLGELPDAPPVFSFPGVPFTLETLRIILPCSMALAADGLLLNAQIVDEMTDTPSNKSQECLGQGAGNIASALIRRHQTVGHVSSGGRGRLSTFAAGAFLLFPLVGLDDLVRILPIAALVWY